MGRAEDMVEKMRKKAHRDIVSDLAQRKHANKREDWIQLLQRCYSSIEQNW